MEGLGQRSPSESGCRMSEKQEYKMPDVEAGMIVRWHPGGKATDATIPAVVSKVGTRALSLKIMEDGTWNFTLKDGVRHVADPGVKTTERHEDGAWSYTQQHTEFLLMKKQLLELLEKVAKK